MRTADFDCELPPERIAQSPVEPRDRGAILWPETERGKLRAELDGLIAHLYGLTEGEFGHILATFPLVPEPVKTAAFNAYRDVEKGLIK